MNAFFETFSKGMILCGAICTSAASLTWHAHKSFAGVFLKNLLTDECTDGMLSCHLVRIAPKMSIGLHSHPDSIELHEVIAGRGTCTTQDGMLPYAPGTISVIARDMPHEVHAGEDGLYLFAKFVSRKT